MGIVDHYQQHEIPQVIPVGAGPVISVSVTQYDQHQVRCGCGRLHTAQRAPAAGW
jgi:hypothetical protein